MAEGRERGPQTAAAVAPNAAEASGRAVRALLWLLLAVAVGGRLLHLDADPHYYGWWGYVSDEGRWTEHARNLVQRGRLIEGRAGTNALIAPAYEAASALVFAVAGVSRIAARTLPVVCGIAWLLAIAAFLWRRATPAAAWLGVALVALQPDLVVLSRVAVPEMPAMLLHFAAFAVLVGGPPRRARLILAGLLAAAAVAVKVTALPMVGVLAGVAWVARDGRGLGRARAGDVAVFALGAAVPGALAAVAALVLVGWESLAARLSFLARFVAVNDLYAMAALPFDGRYAPLLNPAALAVWGAALAWLAVPKADAALRRWGRGAATWAVLHAGVAEVQAYFPERYFVHLFAPLALLAAYAATRLERVGLDGLARGLAARRGAARAAALAVVSGPTGLWLAPLLGAALAAGGLSAERLSVRLLALAIACALAAAVAARTAARPAALAVWVGLPLVAAAAWSSAWVLADRPPSFWLTAPAPAPLARHAALLLAALSVAGLAALARARGRLGVTLPAVALGLAPSLTGAVHLAPGWWTPRYTLSETSRALGELVDGDAPVAEIRAEGLFLDNTLAYTWIAAPELAEVSPAWLLAPVPFDGDAALLATRYERVASFDLHVPSLRWPRPARDPTCPDQRGLCMALYRRRAP